MVEKVITKLDQKRLVLIVVLMNCEPELSYIPAELFNMCLKEFVLYLYKSTIRPCMEYCCHVWAGAPNLFLELLKKTCTGLLALHFLPLLNPWLIVEM